MLQTTEKSSVALPRTYVSRLPETQFDGRAGSASWWSRRPSSGLPPGPPRPPGRFVRTSQWLRNLGNDTPLLWVNLTRVSVRPRLGNSWEEITDDEWGHTGMIIKNTQARNKTKRCVSIFSKEKESMLPSLINT